MFLWSWPSSLYPGSGKTFYFLQNTYTNSEENPASYSMGTGFLFEDKSAGTCS